MPNDDVNDAAWILIHRATDIYGETIAADIGSDARHRLYDAASIYCAVYKRYGGGDG